MSLTISIVCSSHGLFFRVKLVDNKYWPKDLFNVCSAAVRYLGYYRGLHEVLAMLLCGLAAGEYFAVLFGNLNKSKDILSLDRVCLWTESRAFSARVTLNDGLEPITQKLFEVVCDRLLDVSPR